jgi:hypothetical protein
MTAANCCKACGLTTAVTRVAWLRGADEDVRSYTKKRAARKPPLEIRRFTYIIFTLATLMESFPIVPVTAT